MDFLPKVGIFVPFMACRAVSGSIFNFVSNFDSGNTEIAAPVSIKKNFLSLLLIMSQCFEIYLFKIHDQKLNLGIDFLSLEQKSYPYQLQLSCHNTMLT